MIKVLRRRITLVLSICVSFILVAMLVCINIMVSKQITDDVYEKLENTVNAFPMIRRDAKDLSAVFYYGLNPTIIVNDDNDTLEDEELIGFTYNIAFSEKAKHKGKEGNYYYAQKHMSSGCIVVVIDGRDEIIKIKTLRDYSIMGGALGVLFIVSLSIAIARWLTNPVKETVENERAFISDASHELKTPLAVISSNADVLETEVGENKWLSCIRSESMRMSTLINAMLTVSRIEKNNDRVMFTDVNFSACVDEIVMNFEAPAFEKGVLIDSEVQQGVTVHGSSEKLKQLIEILLDNAVKYVNDKGQIKVILKSRLGGALLIVENTGSYIEKDDQKKIFERFYRTDASRAKSEDASKARSYGLGLAIAKRIVEEHSGGISVTSTQKQGQEHVEMLTQFKVTI